MSLKYQRIKQADLSLPAPLRWLTRLFSSITLAVILLTLIALYGVIGSMPLVYLLLAGLYGVVSLGTVGLTVLLLWLWSRRSNGCRRVLRWTAGLVALAAAGTLGIWASVQVYDLVAAQTWYQAYRSTLLYRLPWFEMTELQFYAWWPMQVLLGLFVLNMVWATIRRIEFKFVNTGVLTVHTGIVVVAMGAMLYGYFKVEGDMLLMRRDLGGEFRNTFYDVFTPAVYLTRVDNGQGVMVPLPNLPRYNDYEVGEMDISLHGREGVTDLLGPDVRVTIPGFIAYGDLKQDFLDAGELLRTDSGEPADPEQLADLQNVVVQLASGDADGPDMLAGQPQQVINLVANTPAQRVHEGPRYAVELLNNADEQRIRDLLTTVKSPHTLLVRISDEDFEQQYEISPGQTIELGDTGYTLEVQNVGPYGIPFITPGYEDATDTRATVHLTGNGKDFRRIVMHRYPERSQDFIPAPNDPNVGPMGRRVDPDPDIEMVYLDNTKGQYHLVHLGEDQPFRLIVRLPGIAPMTTPLSEDRFLVPGQFQGHPHWLHVLKKLGYGVPTLRAVSTPRALRNPQDEGDYTFALLPIRVEKDLPDGRTYRQMLWLKHMRYPHWPEQMRRPLVADIPGVGEVAFAFSRRQYQLPFAVALADFEMQPIPGSDIERDFVADLLVGDLNEDGIMFREPNRVQARLNRPVVHRAAFASLPFSAVKLSQIAWDKGNPAEPGHTARDDQGRFINQQRYTILGVSNNVGIRIIFIGAVLIVLGIPWAFYVKPWLLQRQKRKIQEQLAQTQD